MRREPARCSASCSCRILLETESARGSVRRGWLPSLESSDSSSRPTAPGSALAAVGGFEHVSPLPAAGDPDLGKDPAEVAPDRAWVERQAFGNRAIGQPARGGLGDLEL